MHASIDENRQNQYILKTKKYEIRVNTLYSVINSLIREIDERSTQETTTILIGIGQLLKFNLNKNDTDILTNNFNIFKDEF